MMARYTHFSAAVSVGKWPRALTALRIRALMDSMAFVVQTTVRMWVSKSLLQNHFGTQIGPTHVSGGLGSLFGLAC
jgi:hypothetical protein